MSFDDFVFQDATDEQGYLKLMLTGAAGRGKTYTALAIAGGLGKNVVVIDTENGTAAKYSREFPFSFKHLKLSAPFSPERYIGAIQAAQKAGFDVIIIDSLSHAWQGEGGVLEMHQRATERSRTKNSFQAWAKVTPEQNRLIETLLQLPVHTIVTARSKVSYVVEEDERGRSTPKKVGMAPIQREGLDYEFDVHFEMEDGNKAIVQKSRCPALSGQVISKPGAATAKVLLDWLGGVEPPMSPVEEKAFRFLDSSPELKNLYGGSPRDIALQLISDMKNAGVKGSDEGAAEKLLAWKVGAE